MLPALDDDAVEKANPARPRTGDGAELLDECPIDLLPIPARHRRFEFAHPSNHRRRRDSTRARWRSDSLSGLVTCRRAPLLRPTVGQLPTGGWRRGARSTAGSVATIRPQTASRCTPVNYSRATPLFFGG